MKRRRLLKTTALLGATGAALTKTPTTSAQTVNDVAQNVRCYCGCGDLLSMCDCAYAENGKQFIQNQINQGLTQQEIIDTYVTYFNNPSNRVQLPGVDFAPDAQLDYNLRATVAKEGKGLTLWLLPPIAIVIGAAALYYTLIHKKQQNTEPSSTQCPECSETIPPNATYCTKCGTKTPKTTQQTPKYCPACGAKATDAQFCTECGEKL